MPPSTEALSAPGASSETPSLAEFRVVHSAHAAEVWRALFRLGVDSAALDDAMQDVFVTAFRRWDQLRDRSQRRAWLLGIARRIAFRHRRGDARRARRVATVEPWTTPGADPEQHAAALEAGVQLQRFLDDLDEDKRAAFVFGELEELDRNALGAALGVNPNTAYSRLAAARRRFVERFDRHDAAAGVMAVAMGDRDRAPPASRTWVAIVAALPSSTNAPPLSSGSPVVGKILLTLAAAAAITFVAARPAAPGDSPSRKATPAAITEPRRAPAEPAELAAVPSPSPAAIDPAAPVPRQRPPAANANANAPAPHEDEQDPDPDTIEGVDGEVAVLHAARRAIGRGDTAAARTWLALHRERWPDGGAMRTVRDSIERQMIKPTTGGDNRP